MLVTGKGDFMSWWTQVVSSFFSIEQGGGKIGFDPYGPLIYRPQSKSILPPPHVIDAAVRLRPTVLTGLDWPINKTYKQFDRDVEFMKKFWFNIKRRQ